MNSLLEKQIKEDNDILNKILSDWEKDSVVDKTAPNETIAEIGKLHAKYLRTLAQHRLNVKKAERDYKETKQLRSSYYDGTLEESELKKRNWTPYLGKSPKILSQRQDLLDADEYLNAILQRKCIYEEIVSVCESIIQQLNWSRTNQLKEFMAWERTIRNA